MKFLIYIYEKNLKNLKNSKIEKHTFHVKKQVKNEKLFLIFGEIFELLFKKIFEKILLIFKVSKFQSFYIFSFSFSEF
jgi:hypothetical protein